MNIQQLRQHIAKIDKLSDAGWAENLIPRKAEERQFSNENDFRDETQKDIAEVEEKHSNLRAYGAVERSNRYMFDWIRKNSPKKVVLDFACGEGDQTFQAAAAFAALAIGLDISDDTIRKCNAKAERAAKRGEGNAQNAIFYMGDCERTELPDNSIDTMICSGMLHHLDLTQAYPEMHRILKPGGKIIAKEALNYNPVINWYRQRTPEKRTAWEKDHILGLKEVRLGQKYFDLTDIRYWHMTAPLAAYLRLPHPLLKLSDMVDNVLFERIPLLNRWAWQFTFEFTKRA